MSFVFRFLRTIFIATLIFIILIFCIQYFQSQDDRFRQIDDQVKASRDIKNAYIQIDQSKKIHEFKKNLTAHDRFYVASISKLFTYSVVFQLIDEGKLSMNTRMVDVLGKDKVDHLLTIDGKDKTSTITVDQLLNQTTALPDYESDHLDNEPSIGSILQKQDLDFPPSAAISLTKQLPGKHLNHEAYYSGMNATLLGMMIEKITHQSLEENFKSRIFKPLGLKDTAVPDKSLKISDTYYKDRKVNNLLYAQSNIAPAGLVSSGHDLMIFIKSYFDGQLFKKSHISHPDFVPLQGSKSMYAHGLMRVDAYGVVLDGHAGSTGSFAFYAPKKKTYIVGTINQNDVNQYKIISAYIDSLD